MKSTVCNFLTKYYLSLSETLSTYLNMASRIIELWGRPTQSKSQEAEADSNHVPPDQEGDCQVEIANNENSNESKKKLEQAE